jgi:hypothetical protein
MMTVETIRNISRDAALKAASEKALPFIIWPEDMGANITSVCKSLPFLGDYLPKGWKRVSLKGDEHAHGVYMGDNSGFGAYFVDATGFADGTQEPAMSIDQFGKVLEVGRAYGLVEVGQFQVKVGVFEKIKEVMADEK